MILNGCTSRVGSGFGFPSSSTSKPLVSACISRLTTKAASSSIPIPHSKSRFCSSKGLSAGSTLLLSGDKGGLWHTLPSLPRQRKPNLRPRAAKDALPGFRFPPMTRKPRFWWRILACLPYLLPLHESWMFGETAYHLHPFFEDYEFLTYPFLSVLGQLPRWSLIVYFIVAYLGIVRRKEWPHFVRFHVVMGMLIEIGFQVTGYASRLMPRALYWGKIGMHVWIIIAFGHLFTVLECIRCALTGVYADVPFASDAAYIQMPYDN